jgi:hypothetical protein
MIRSKSGAKAPGLANPIELLPAVSGTEIVAAPTAAKLPVGVKATVWAGPPCALTVACRPVAEPSHDGDPVGARGGHGHAGERQRAAVPLAQESMNGCAPGLL